MLALFYESSTSISKPLILDDLFSFFNHNYRFHIWILLEFYLFFSGATFKLCKFEIECAGTECDRKILCGFHKIFTLGATLVEM